VLAGVVGHHGSVLTTGSEVVEAAERELSSAFDVRPRDAARRAVALERAIGLARADAQAAEYFDLSELYDLLADEYEQLGRVAEALSAMRDALAAGWNGRPDGRCRLAEILMRAGRVDEATVLWTQVKADTPDDVWLYNNAGIEYAHAGDHAAALGWLTDGLTLALSAGDPEDLVGQLAEFRGASLAALDRSPDEVQRRAEAFLAAGPARRRRGVQKPQRRVPAAAQPMTVAWAWFPAGEYAEALRRWPDLAEPGGPAAGGRDHAGYCQAKLVEAADAGMAAIRIAPIRIPDYLAWCTDQDEDPAQARAPFAADLARSRPGELIRWPPGRNEPCWCGSGRKYKKCCAAPHPG
jgi:tetratricopeptide (TPR) repeat protein